MRNPFDKILNWYDCDIDDVGFAYLCEDAIRCGFLELSKHYDDMATVKKMKEIVPEYKSNNSIYEKLDSGN
jgi:hypothetical protein